MPNSVKLFVVGDIIGKGARNALICKIPELKEKYNYDILAVNAENTTHGRGLNHNHYLAYKKAGVDVMTMGNHVLGEATIIDYIDYVDDIVVPGNVNYTDKTFDKHKEANIKFGDKNIKFVNVLGINTTNKLEITDKIDFFSKYADDNSILIVDFHGEYTLEKSVFAYYFDGIVSLVYGTHTHVQTADERILPKGTAFISDVGMCGSRESVIGYDYKSCVDKIKTHERSAVSTLKPYMINAILVEIDLDTRKAIKIERINEILEWKLESFSF